MDPSLIAWANSVWEPDRKQHSNEVMVTSGVNDDYIGAHSHVTRKRLPLLPAQGLATAGKGSTWVYDYAHHLAAGTMCCEFAADFVFMALPPPRPLPQRDLSHIRTYHGLHIGMTINDAAAALLIPRATIHLNGTGFEMLRVFKPRPHGFGGFLGLIYFKNGSAIGYQVGQADS